MEKFVWYNIEIAESGEGSSYLLQQPPARATSSNILPRRECKRRDSCNNGDKIEVRKTKKTQVLRAYIHGNGGSNFHYLFNRVT